MKAVRLPDARTTLLESLRAGTEAYASELDLARSILMLAATDPDAAAAVRRFEHGRWPGMRNLAGRLETQGYLRDDLSRDEAAQILWVLTSFAPAPRDGRAHASPRSRARCAMIGR